MLRKLCSVYDNTLSLSRDLNAPSTHDSLAFGNCSTTGGEHCRQVSARCTKCTRFCSAKPFLCRDVSMNVSDSAVSRFFSTSLSDCVAQSRCISTWRTLQTVTAPALARGRRCPSRATRSCCSLTCAHLAAAAAARRRHSSTTTTLRGTCPARQRLLLKDISFLCTHTCTYMHIPVLIP